MSLIYGKDGYNKLQCGYETNVNDSLRRSFSVASAQTDGILPGDLLITGAASQVYSRPAGALAGAQKIAGIALATNVLVDRQYPQSAGEVPFKPGIKAAALIRGSVAVPLTGNAPTEGASVYYNFTAKAFTATEAGNISLPGARFTGRVEGNVAEIYVQYI